MKIKKIILSFFCFLFLFNITQAKKRKVEQDIYWQLDYSVNKYGEIDKPIGAFCGQYNMLNKIYVDNTGVTFSVKTIGHAKIDPAPAKISILFDGKKEIIINDVAEISQELSPYRKGYFISKDNAKYKELINNIKNSKYMSIIIEENSGKVEKMVEVVNRYSADVLSELEKNL